MTVGQKLKIDLGLVNFPYVYIRRMLGRSPRLYQVYVDTYLPNLKIMPAEVKAYETCQILSVAGQKLKKPTFTRPIPIEDFDEKIGPKDIIVFFDAAGEYKFREREFLEGS